MLAAMISAPPRPVIEFPGNRTYATLTADDVTVPHDIELRFQPGAVICIASRASTLTINGDIEAGRHQIFAGSGDVVFGQDNQIIYSEWFATLQAAVDAMGEGDTLIGGDHHHG